MVAMVLRLSAQFVNLFHQLCNLDFILLPLAERYLLVCRDIDHIIMIATQRLFYHQMSSLPILCFEVRRRWLSLLNDGYLGYASG